MGNKRAVTFPYEVPVGSCIVKIYKVANKGRDSFMVSFFADGKRHQRMFVSFDEAKKHAQSDANWNGHFRAKNDESVSGIVASLCQTL